MRQRSPREKGRSSRRRRVDGYVCDEDVAVKDPAIGVGVEQGTDQHGAVGQRRLVADQSLSHHDLIVSSSRDMLVGQTPTRRAAPMLHP